MATGVQSPLLDNLALIFLIARLAQTSVHVGRQHSDWAATVRFSFFFIQLVCIIWMGIYVAVKAS